MRILAIDVGTSSVKAAVLEVESAAPVGEITKVTYELDAPVADAAEIPSIRLWDAVHGAARSAAASGRGIEGIGLSCLTPALILLDSEDRPLLPIWTHLDRRSRPQARRIWNEVGADFMSETGNRPLPGGISVVSWTHMLEQKPELAGQIRAYLHVNSWLGLKLTGEKAFDPGNASFTGLFGTLTTRMWAERWCHYFRVDPSWLPPVIDGAAVLGRLRPALAAEWGLATGLPVKLGTADTSSAILATGMTEGDLLHVVGTTQVLATYAERPVPGTERLTRLLGVGRGMIQVTHNPVGGAALAWLHELVFSDQTENEFFEQTVPSALDKATEVTLDPPFLGGDRLEIEPRRAAFRELTLATRREDLLAAVLAAMRAGHRRAFQDLGMRESVRRVFLTGGGAAVVRRLIPEYTGARITELKEGSLRGVARLF